MNIRTNNFYPLPTLSKMTRFCVLLMGLLSFIGIAPLSGQVVFEATTNTKQVPLNGQFKVSFTIKNGTNVKGFTPPDFNPFKSNGPSTSSSMQIMNGSVSKSESYTYILRPTQKGTFKIPPATVSNDGKRIRSNSIKIEVVDAVKQKTSSPNGDGTQGVDEDELRKNLYVRVIPNKRKAYKGEEIILTYKLFSRVRTSNINYTKTPQYNGFLHHEIELSEQAQRPKNEVIDGVQFQTQTFKKVAVFATQSGNLQLPAIEFSADVLFQERDPFFRSSFFTRTKRYPFEFKSNTLLLDIQDLPPAQQGFTGGVGKFNYNVQYDKTNTAANEPITLKISASGQGNISMIDIPDIEFPASFESYDPKIKEKIRKSGSHISGSKTYEYLLVPRGGGEFKMPDLNLSYFDTEKGAYQAQQFEGPTIRVTGEMFDDSSINQNSGSVSKNDAQQIDVLNNDIRFIQGGSIAQQPQSTMINSVWFWVLSALPILLLFGLPYFISGMRVRRKKQISSGEMAEKNALKKLKSLDASADKIENEIQSILWSYISEKTKVPIAQLNKQRAKEILTPEISEDQAGKLVQFIDRCEQLAYTPNADTQKPILKDEIITLFKNLDRK